MITIISALAFLTCVYLISHEPTIPGLGLLTALAFVITVIGGIKHGWLFVLWLDEHPRVFESFVKWL